MGARADGRPSFSIPAASKWSSSSKMLVAIEVTIFCHLTKADHQAIPHNCGQLAGRASHRYLVPRGHDQRRLALLVHTAEPTCVRKQLTLLPVTDAGRLAYLHRHTAARAGVAITGNYNRFSSLSSFHSRPSNTLMNPPRWRAQETIGLPWPRSCYFRLRVGPRIAGSLSLASLGRGAIAELAGPALEFPSVIERMMLPKFLGRLKAE